jgi:photosystem II stability/assembly factor-like uncharacterized protein
MKSMVLRWAVLLAALLAPAMASAQWERVPGFDGTFFDEVFFTDVDHGWAAESFSARIVYTTDGGATWNDGFLPGAAGSKMRDLAFVNNNVGFATGTDGVFKTTNGGRTWTDITPDGVETIPAVWFRTVNEGVIGLGGCNGDQVVFMHTTDGGASWTPTQYTVDFDASVGGIRYDNGTWYAAGGMGKIWRSFDGENWTVENNGSGGWQEDIDVVDGTIFTASTTGGSCESEGGGRMMALQAGETNWLFTDPETSFPFWGVSALSSSVAWACGDEGNIYRTTDGGRWWHRFSCGLGDNDHVDDIAFVDDTHGWAVGDGIFRYTGRVDILPVTVTPVIRLCAGEQAQFDAAGGDTYHWEPSTGLSDPDVANPIVTATTTTTYTVTVTSARGCTGSATVTVVVGTPAASLQLPVVTADVRDDDVEIPIRTLGPLSQGSCVAESMTITVGIDATVFYPRSVSRGRITQSLVVGGERLVTIAFTRAELDGVTDVLTTITGNAMLGNVVESPISVAGLTFNGAQALPDVVDGRLVLTGVCMTDNGPRLYSATHAVIGRIAPNPSRGPVSVEILSDAAGAHSLEIFSARGDRVYATRWDAPGGEDRRTITLPDALSSGAYDVVLRAGDLRDAESLIITK